MKSVSEMTRSYTILIVLVGAALLVVSSMTEGALSNMLLYAAIVVMGSSYLIARMIAERRAEGDTEPK